MIAFYFLPLKKRKALEKHIDEFYMIRSEVIINVHEV